MNIEILTYFYKMNILDEKMLYGAKQSIAAELKRMTNSEEKCE